MTVDHSNRTPQNEIFQKSEITKPETLTFQKIYNNTNISHHPAIKISWYLTIEKQGKIIGKENTKTEDSSRDRGNKITPQTGEHIGGEISFKYTKRLCEYACGGSTRNK